jgi:hypothetical protein
MLPNAAKRGWDSQQSIDSCDGLVRATFGAKAQVRKPPPYFMLYYDI